MAKILLWDIESSNLNADFGYMICFGYKWLGESKVHVISIDDFDLHKKDPTNDREVCRAALDVLKSSDMWVTWFGCPTPDQRILKSDLTYARADELNVGDELISFDENPLKKQERRKWRTCKVEALRKFKDVAYEITLEDGSVLRGTWNHPILCYNKTNINWTTFKNLTPGREICRILPSWNADQSYGAGWLSGFFDGEGSISQALSKNRYSDGTYNLGIYASQNIGPTLDKCVSILKDKGIKHSVCPYDPGNDKIRAVNITGGIQEKIKFLGSIRPQRLLNKFNLSKLNSLKFNSRVKVVSVKELGVVDIVGITTSNGTYVMEGFGCHNSRFDIPFVRARLLSHRDKIKDHVLPDRPHVDGWWVCRHKLKIHSNRLASASSFLGVSEKTPIKPEHWIKAMSGNSKSIKYIKDHCRQDVVVLEDVYKELMPYHTTHPNVALMDGRPGCPNCGKDKLVKHGVYVARTNIFQRYQCTSCLSWSRFGKAHKVTGK